MTSILGHGLGIKDNFVEVMPYCHGLSIIVIAIVGFFIQNMFFKKRQPRILGHNEERERELGEFETHVTYGKQKMDN